MEYAFQCFETIFLLFFRHTLYVSVPRVASNRPELGGASSNIIQSDITGQEAMEKLNIARQCHQAVLLITEYEKKLKSEGLLCGKNSLMVLEKHVQNYAQKGNNDILYVAMFRVNGQLFTRIIENGSLRGFSQEQVMEDTFPSFKESLKYHVFSEEDLCEKKSAAGILQHV